MVLFTVNGFEAYFSTEVQENAYEIAFLSMTVASSWWWNGDMKDVEMMLKHNKLPLPLEV